MINQFKAGLSYAKFAKQMRTMEYDFEMEDAVRMASTLEESLTGDRKQLHRILGRIFRWEIANEKLSSFVKPNKLRKELSLIRLSEKPDIRALVSIVEHDGKNLTPKEKKTQLIPWYYLVARTYFEWMKRAR